MGFAFSLVVFASILGGLVGLKWVLENFNKWIYESKLGDKRHLLPPGDYGWPLVGNMWSFLRAFKSQDPDSFTRSLVTRFGNTGGIYKAFMFGKPCIVAISPEANKKVLTDDEHFTVGWPKATHALMGRKSFVGDYSYEEHKRLRRLTSAPVNGHEALTMYIPYIEEAVIEALKQWSAKPEIELLTELRRLTFRVITYIFLGIEGDKVVKALEKDYTNLNYGIRAQAINLPGFAYHRALKAREKLVRVFQAVVTVRRERRRNNAQNPSRDMLDLLMDIKDEKGVELDDETIIDLLLMYLNAGHESSGHTSMWACLLLNEHPEAFKIAKAEQEEIAKSRPPSQKYLSLKEIRSMKYLDQVVDETLRWVSFSSMVFREAKKDCKFAGYIIPKGWRTVAWMRAVHFDPETYPDPYKFDPSRWENFIPKLGTFLPFGAGSRLCPGNDLAKLEITIFLHHFLLNYRFKRSNPKGIQIHLPHPRPKDNCLGKLWRVTDRKPVA